MILLKRLEVWLFASQERMSNLEKEELLKEDSKELDLPLYI
jgi:hypothetical protein